MTSLDLLRIGEEATVIKVSGDIKLRQRLYDMGITPGVRVLFRKKAPLGDPIEITVRGYELTLRMSDAKYIYIKTGDINETSPNR